jgi:hypothetical protein
MGMFSLLAMQPAATSSQQVSIHVSEFVSRYGKNLHLSLASRFYRPDIRLGAVRNCVGVGSLQIERMSRRSF